MYDTVKVNKNFSKYCWYN